MRKIDLANMDEDDALYHLSFRPRAISGRRLHPNGGHRRPRPFGGVYATRYCHANPTSEPIGRSVAAGWDFLYAVYFWKQSVVTYYSKFLEQQSLPAPIITGNVVWDTFNVNLKDMFESVVGQGKHIHSKLSITPKLKGNSSKVAKIWKLCDGTLSLARQISVFLRQEGFLPYPEPLWFSSREVGMHTFHDITVWNEYVHGLVAAKANGCGALPSALAGMAKDDGNTFLGSKLDIEDGVLPDRAKKSGMLAEEAVTFSEEKESKKIPADRDDSLGENKECSKLNAEEELALAEKAKNSSKFLADKGIAIAEKLRAEEEERAKEERALAEKARWSNWPSSFINWDYKKKFEKEMAEAEAREQARERQAKDVDEWEEKARWSLGA